MKTASNFWMAFLFILDIFIDFYTLYLYYHEQSSAVFGTAVGCIVLSSSIQGYYHARRLSRTWYEGILIFLAQVPFQLVDAWFLVKTIFGTEAKSEEKQADIKGKVAILWGFEAMLETAPQFMINIYVLSNCLSSTSSRRFQYFSAVVSFISLSLEIARFVKYLSLRGVQKYHFILLAIYKGFLVAGRMLAFIYFVSLCKWWTILIIVFHGYFYSRLVDKFDPDRSLLPSNIAKFVPVLEISVAIVTDRYKPLNTKFKQFTSFEFLLIVLYSFENLLMSCVPSIFMNVNENCQINDDPEKVEKICDFCLLPPEVSVPMVVLSLQVIGLALAAVYNRFCNQDSEERSLPITKMD